MEALFSDLWISSTDSIKIDAFRNPGSCAVVVCLCWGSLIVYVWTDGTDNIASKYRRVEVAGTLLDVFKLFKITVPEIKFSGLLCAVFISFYLTRYSVAAPGILHRVGRLEAKLIDTEANVF